MMTSVVAFLFAGQIAHFAFNSEAPLTDGYLWTFLSWIGSFLWFLMPIKSVPQEVKQMSIHFITTDHYFLGVELYIYIIFLQISLGNRL